MTDEEKSDIENMVHMNQRLLLILGFGTSIVLELRKLMDNPDDPRVLWFIQAMENVVYLDKPLPPMP